jgi:hypothetical protein
VTIRVCLEPEAKPRLALSKGAPLSAALRALIRTLAEQAIQEFLIEQQAENDSEGNDSEVE